jgi:hypothetical protein
MTCVRDAHWHRHRASLSCDVHASTRRTNSTPIRCEYSNNVMLLLLEYFRAPFLPKYPVAEFTGQLKPVDARSFRSLPDRTSFLGTVYRSATLNSQTFCWPRASHSPAVIYMASQPYNHYDTRWQPGPSPSDPYASHDGTGPYFPAPAYPLPAPPNRPPAGGGYPLPHKSKALPVLDYVSKFLLPQSLG